MAVPSYKDVLRYSVPYFRADSFFGGTDDRQSKGLNAGGLGTSAKLGGRPISVHFFPYNAIVLMLKFAKVGGAAAPSALAVPGPLSSTIICTFTLAFCSPH